MLVRGCGGTLLNRGRPSRGGAWEKALDDLLPLAERAHRGVVDDASDPAGAGALVRFLRAATPRDEIERLNIGAGPPGAARRRGSPTCGARVFARTQSPVALPGGYGLGSALTGWAGDDQWALPARCAASGPSSRRSWTTRACATPDSRRRVDASGNRG